LAGKDCGKVKEKPWR